MGLESAQFIHQLITANPEQEDLRRQGDDHLRMLKQSIVNTFPNVTGAVLASQDELNLLRGLVEIPNVNIVTVVLDITSDLAPGAHLIFQKAAAGVLTTDGILPLPGLPYSSFPGLLITSWRPLTDAIELVLINAGSIAVPSTSLSTPIAVLR